MPKMPNRKYEPFKGKTLHKPQNNWLANPEHIKIYKSARWRKLRESYFQRNPSCVMCGRGGKYVDHILPVSQGGDIWDEDNLQTLCPSCNGRKTNAQKLK